MKKLKDFMNIKTLVIIIFIIYISFPILGGYLNIGDDTSFHLLRIDEIYNNLKNGNILPTIYANSMNGYGYANPFFYPDLFLYIPAILMFLGLKVAVAYKVAIILFTIITMWITHYSVKNIFKSENIAFLSMIGYTGCIYRVYNIQVRGALGEIIAMSFLPLIIYGLYRIVYEGDSDYRKRKNTYLILSIGFTLTLYSHLISFFIMVLTAGIYFLKNIKKIIVEKRYIDILKAILTSLGLTAPFLLPMLYMMSKDTYYYNETFTFKLTDKLVNILKTLEININPYILFIIWLIFLILFISIVKFIFKRFNFSEVKKRAITMLFVGVLLTVSVTDLVPWVVVGKIFPPIEAIQFPFRLLSLGLFLITISNCVIIDKVIGKFKIEMVIVFIITVVLSINTLSFYMFPGKNDYIPDNYDVGQGEYIPSGYDFDFNINRGNTVSSKDINLKIISDNKDYRNREIIFKTNIINDELTLPYTYYYGYEITVNGAKVENFKTDKALLGVKLNDLTEGHLTVKYKQPVIRYISIGLCILTILSIVYTKKRP